MRPSVGKQMFTCFLAGAFYFSGVLAVNVLSRWAFGANMTSYERRCDVMTSHRRSHDVIFTLCARRVPVWCSGQGVEFDRIRF